MKKYITFFLLLILLILFSGFSYAVTLPYPRITSYKYSIGDKMKEKEIEDVQIGKEVQLNVVVAYGNEGMFRN